MTHHVLLIEDEPSIAEALRFILSRDGWKVDTHADGSNALETIESKKPDVVILDVTLPHRSGFDILTDLRANPAFLDLPVMILTARGQEKDRERAEAIGATHFMTKPFSNAEVLETLKRLAPN